MENLVIGWLVMLLLMSCFFAVAVVVAVVAVVGRVVVVGVCCVGGGAGGAGFVLGQCLPLLPLFVVTHPFIHYYPPSPPEPKTRVLR